MESSQILLKTIDFAAKKHSTQRRKDPQQTPYINHPIGVANTLAQHGVTDIATLQAAILHDTVEDTQTTYEELVQEFGKIVADLVMEVTDDKTLDTAARKQAQVDKAPFKSKKAKQVKMADKLYNLRDLARQVPVGWTKLRVEEYYIWALKVIAGCRGALPSLEAELDSLYRDGTFTFGGETYPCFNSSKV